MSSPVEPPEPPAAPLPQPAEWAERFVSVCSGLESNGGDLLFSQAQGRFLDLLVDVEKRFGIPFVEAQSEINRYLARRYPEEYEEARRATELRESPWRVWPTPDEVLAVAPNPGDRLKAGLPSFDKATRGGVPRGRVVGLQGKPGGGKTAFAKTLGAKWARDNAAVFIGIFADEGAESAAVMIGQDFGIERERLEGEDPEARRALAALNASCAIHLPDPGDPETIIEAIVEKLESVPTVCPIVLVLDSVQTIRCREGDKAKTDRERVTKVMEAARLAAKRLGAVVLVVAQVNRGSYRNKTESENVDPLAAGAESRAIEYCSDVLLHFSGDPEKTVTVEIVKNRLGNKATFRLRFDPKTATFAELDEATADAEVLAEREARERAKLADFGARIKKALRERPGLTGRQIREFVSGGRDADFHAARKALQESGEIVGETGPKRSVLWRLSDSSGRFLGDA